MAFENTIGSLNNLGLFDVILPFVLIFVIVFAVLQKIKLWEDDNAKKFNGVIALVMGASVVVPHVLGWYPPGRDIVNIINAALPNISILLVAVVMGLIIIGVFGKKATFGGQSASGIIALLATIAVLYIFGQAAGWWAFPSFLYPLLDPDTQALVLVILVFAVIIWWVTKEDKSGEDKPSILKKIGEEIFKE